MPILLSICHTNSLLFLIAEKIYINFTVLFQSSPLYHDVCDVLFPITSSDTTSLSVVQLSRLNHTSFSRFTGKGDNIVYSSVLDRWRTSSQKHWSVSWLMSYILYFFDLTKKLRFFIIQNVYCIPNATVRTSQKKQLCWLWSVSTYPSFATTVLYRNCFCQRQFHNLSSFLPSFLSFLQLSNILSRRSDYRLSRFPVMPIFHIFDLLRSR